MEILEIVLISIGLAMDAFAVSICKGVQFRKMDWNKAITIGFYFGFFQALMPTIGYLLGNSFEDLLIKIDHWITFILLSVIGTNMIKEALEKNRENINDEINVKTMILLAVATSIDALAVGITFAFLDVNLQLSVSIIGLIAFIFSVIGVKIGNKFGDKYKTKAQIAGGVILILMGLKILLQHLCIL